jgi:hypothetical protein
MKIFLKLKHWQLLVIWIITDIVLLATMQTQIWIISILLFGFTIAGWIYSIGKVINKLNTKTNIENYREDIWFILYLLALIPFGYFYRNIEYPGSINGFIIFGTGIIGFISMVKLINFAAKSLKQYENKQELKFDDYSSEFFLIIFFIIGLWFIQPRLNKIVDK